MLEKRSMIFVKGRNERCSGYEKKAAAGAKTAPAVTNNIPKNNTTQRSGTIKRLANIVIGEMILK